MSAQNAATPPSEPVKPPNPSGFRTALKYTGFPVSWLDKRPKLPSRNWLIFLSVTSSIAGLYIYDRRQCKLIRKHYVDLVKDQAEVLVNPLDWPRRVTVLGSKWPGDEDYDQAIKYFRKYVKPILVAAAVDFEMVAGKRHGELADRIANEIRLRRRMDLEVDHVSEVTMSLPTYKPLPEARRHALEGGFVIIGRPTLKEFLAGLKKGWTEGLEKVDRQELLARELESDGHFDEPDEPGDDSDAFPSADKPKLSTPLNSPVYSPLQIRPPHPNLSPKPGSSISESMNMPPVELPPLPPLLLVTFTNYIGLSQIPIIMWEFFNQRHKVRSGAEAGYRLVMKHTRPFIPPTAEPESVFADSTPQTNSNRGDLDFDKHVESFYKNSLSSIPADIEKARKKYYEALPAKLATARALARGTREPTKEEMQHPPPTEVELSAERMKKELNWRHDLEGWEIVKPEAEVVWDDRLRGSLRVFVDPPTSETEFTGSE